MVGAPFHIVASFLKLKPWPILPEPWYQVFGLLPSPMRSERFAAVIHGEQGVFTLVVGGTKNQRNYVRSLREFNEAVRQ